jgi:hypothetical protein
MMAITNKRKRSAGAGRKPKGPIGENSSWLQARITDDLRTRLDQAAIENGRSLSQEAQVRLKASFDLPAELQKSWGPPHIKDLAQLIAIVVRRIESDVSGQPFAQEAGDWAWHRNAFTHAAVREAINVILAYYRPHGAIEVPAEVRRLAEFLGPERAAMQSTPEGVGHTCALGVLYQAAIHTEPPPLARGATGYGRLHHVLPNIRKHLGEPK